jgi:hypothetical protein
LDKALASLDERFAALYQHTGRSSIAPEMLLRATLLQGFFSVRSERQLMEQINYNLLLRWFVGLSMGAGVWNPTGSPTIAIGCLRPKWRERFSRRWRSRARHARPSPAARAAGAQRDAAHRRPGHGFRKRARSPRWRSTDARCATPATLVSQTIRNRIEESFAWVKKPGGLAKVKLRGRAKVEAAFIFAVIAYNLVRIPRLLAGRR